MKLIVAFVGFVAFVATAVAVAGLAGIVEIGLIGYGALGFVAIWFGWVWFVTPRRVASKLVDGDISVVEGDGGRFWWRGETEGGYRFGPSRGQLTEAEAWADARSCMRAYRFRRFARPVKRR